MIRRWSCLVVLQTFFVKPLPFLLRKRYTYYRVRFKRFKNVFLTFFLRPAFFKVFFIKYFLSMAKNISFWLSYFINFLCLYKKEFIFDIVVQNKHIRPLFNFVNDYFLYSISWSSTLLKFFFLSTSKLLFIEGKWEICLLAY